MSKQEREFTSRVGRLSGKRIDRISKFIIGEHEYLMHHKSFFESVGSTKVLDQNSLPMRGIARKLDVSKSSAYRDVKFMVDNGYMALASVSEWRPNAKRHYYRMTLKALALATELMESAE